MPDPEQQISRELFTARTEAFQQTKITNALKTILLVIFTLATALLIARYVATQPVASSQILANDAAIRHKIVDLEKDIAHLKTDLDLARKPNVVTTTVQSVAAFAVSNWVLLTFLVTIASAIYVKIRFNIDYFESIRDQATKKTLSEFYRFLGDRMMVTGEWNAGEAAYRDAIAINPTNIKASYGIAKVSVFQPMTGQKFYAPDIADAKLDYLIANPPKNATELELRRNLAELYFLKSRNRSFLADEDGNREWLNKAIAADPSYFIAYINLGFIYNKEGNIEKAIDCYQKAAALEPDFQLVNNNLGSCYSSAAQFDKAIEYLARANRVAPSLVTQLSLADANRYAGRIDEALRIDKVAATNVASEGIENERYAADGRWSWSFTPLHEHDTETPRRTKQITSFTHKKMIAYTMVAFDRALLGKFPRADEDFNNGRACDEAGEYNDLFINNIDAILYFLKPQGAIRDWFEDKKTKLSAPPSRDWT
jgi:tetratricopeptide (TPR) repeat protein